MNLAQLEKKLEKHAKATKSAMATPFDIEREELYIMKKRSFKPKKLLLTAIIVCLIGITAFSAIHFLSPKEVAEEIGDTALSQYFDEDNIISETKTDGKYKATVLGIASGQKISNFKSSSWDLFPDRTYVAVAVEKTDGSDMTYDDEILVTPLIQGLNPQRYNIVTMNGGYSAKIIDGILYRITECDSVEFFADRNIYLAVTDTTFLNKNQYNFDEKNGIITENENYEGTNILFDLELDKSKADPQKARDYLERLEEN